MESGAADELQYLPLHLRVFFFLLSLACESPSWLPCLIRSVAPEIRICEFIPATACVLYRVFFLYSESISGPDALHNVLNSGFVHTLPKEQASAAQQIIFLRGHEPYTLAREARPSVNGCRTSLSVSLSLSLSRGNCKNRAPKHASTKRTLQIPRDTVPFTQRPHSHQYRPRMRTRSMRPWARKSAVAPPRLQLCQRKPMLWRSNVLRNSCNFRLAPPGVQLTIESQASMEESLLSKSRRTSGSKMRTLSRMPFW